MSIIDLKLKTYDELTFEITRLNTDKYLLEQKLQQKENIIKGLDNTIENLEEVVEHKENIIKEVEKFVEEVLSSTKGVINDYMYHKEHNKERIELLREDIVMYKHILEILDKGE